ncbi:MAG: tetratricopeptide repeat protein [Leucothrix sp.]
MTANATRMVRVFVMGLVLCLSLGVDAQNRTNPSNTLAQQLFIMGSELIKQNKLKRGISFLQQAATKGHGRAAFELASLYEVGLVVDKNFQLAKQYYEISVTNGNRDAHFNLALLLSSPMTPNNDLVRAREVVEVIAEQGDIEAQFLLANLMKRKLQNVATKPGKAFYWLQHAANSGHGKAQFQLATQYMKGEHVSRSTKTALKWFKRAALQKIPQAHYNLAVMNEKGDGVPSNMTKAIEWYQSAAALGNADAQQNLGIKYLTGDAVTSQPEKGLQLLTEAARSGSRNSQLLLGKLYHTGYQDRIPADLAKAEQWYLRSARQGKTEAQYQLALILLDKKQSKNEAKFWIRRAVAAGHVEATKLQANL